LDGGYRVGDLTVTIPRNPSGGSTPFTLLRAESRLERVFGPDIRVAYALRRNLALELRGAYASPVLDVTISQDSEVAGAASATERLSQYVVDVSAMYLLPVGYSASLRSFVIGGAGYLRQLREGRLEVETGQTVHVGGGVTYWVRGAPRPLRPVRRSLGVRGEARYVVRLGGMDFEDRVRNFPSVSALVAVGF
jgi:hypothetical protein